MRYSPGQCKCSFMAVMNRRVKSIDGRTIGSENFARTARLHSGARLRVNTARLHRRRTCSSCDTHELRLRPRFSRTRSPGERDNCHEQDNQCQPCRHGASPRAERSLISNANVADDGGYLSGDDGGYLSEEAYLPKIATREGGARN